MATAIFILVLATAIAGLVKVLSKKVKLLKPFRWYLAIVIEVVGITIAVLHFVALKPPEEPLTRDEAKEMLREFKDSVMCSIEGLKQSLQHVPQEDEARREHLDTVYIQAECVDQAGLAQTALDSAVVAIGLGDYGKALVLLDDARQGAGGDSAKLSEIYFYIGVAHHFSGNHELALASCDSAIAYKHDKHETWCNRGCDLGQLGRHDDAIASYDSAIAYKHDDHEAWYNRGVALDHLGRYDDAIASYDTAIAYKHNYHDAWNNRGYALRKIGRYVDAIASYDSAIAYKHDKHEAWYNRGIALAHLDRYQEALASCDSAIAYKHDLQEAWYNRGWVLNQLGRYEDAIASYDRAIAHKHDSHEAWNNRGGALRNLGRYDDAIASYDSAIAYKHDLHEACYNRGIALAYLDRYQEALASCDSAVKYNPGDTTVTELRLRILEMQDSTEDTVE